MTTNRIAGQLPPHDLDAERAVLSAALLSRDALDHVADVLEPVHFYTDSHRLIWAAILEVAKGGAAADVVTVAGVLRDAGTIRRVGGVAYLGQVVDCSPAVANVRDHAKIVRECHRLRDLIALCHRLAAEGYQVSSRDAATFADEAQAEVWKIVASDDHERLTRLSDQIQPCYDRLVALANGDRGALGAVSTGFNGLDSLLSGWFPGDLTTLAARPSMGKTGLALQLALRLAKTEGDALVISLEMGSEQLTSRLVALEAQVDLNLLRRGDIRDVDWQRIVDANESLSRVGEGLWVDDTASASLFEVSAKARRVQAVARAAGRELRLVVVDYLQLMKPATRDGTREQQVSEMSRGLKGLAKDLGVSVLMLSQLSRAVESRPDKRPQLSDLRESGAIEQDSDNVLFLYRPGYYDRDNDDGSTELIVAKQRNGPTGVVPLRFYAGCAAFEEA